ncbi:MAG: hypothetical protein D6784_01210 [Chloroflexi bacterium]|nr:MAG: hypothetical protein D6784_01210 [Chloroflexota bacterium]
MTILTLILIGFALRLFYLTRSHPFFDEYTTVLAARQILSRGWPVLPSGLFYEHGLLASYLIAPFTALYIFQPVDQWQTAHWGLMLSRWPSLLVGGLTIPLVYAIIRREQRPAAGRGSQFVPLLAAGLFALSPEGMVWGGRARMYALATLLVWLTVWLAWRGTAPGPAGTRFRRLALLALLATLLTQFGALLAVPALVAGMVAAGWLARGDRRPWFLHPAALLDAAGLAVVTAAAVLVKRLGQPLGAAPLTATQGDELGTELWNTIAYQTALHFTWPDTVKFLAREFGVPHHYWLTLLALAGLAVGLTAAVLARQKIRPTFPLFAGLVFGLTILELVTLLEPFRRNPRYVVMFLPLFYTAAAAAISALGRLTPLLRRQSLAQPVAAVGLLIVLVTLGRDDLRVAAVTPEPAYEQAFAWLRPRLGPDDAILTMNTPAAGLYLDRVDGFAVQQDADQFLLTGSGAAVDRWLGVPWVGSAADFAAVLNNRPTAWFIIDTIRLPVYFRGDWLALVRTQMEQVWASDNALIFRTRDDRTPTPTRPDHPLDARLGDTIRLEGYTLTRSPSPPALHLTLFWRPTASIDTDYTKFIHLRNADGVTVAQHDSQPLGGLYPTSRWQAGETVIDPVVIPLPPDLPPGQYRIFTGLYRLDTLERLPVTNDTSGENAVILPGGVNLP